MRRARTLVTAATSAALLAGGVVAGASTAAASDSPRQDGFAAARAATATFHDIAVAKAAGFGELKDAAGIACIDNPAGGMGIHYVNGSRVVDGVLDAARPEVLVYEPQADGSMRLGALEYVIFASDWKGPGAPSLYGHEFEYMPGQDEPHPNRYGLPAFWELHTWVWNQNPEGIFEDWNPKVSCP